MSKKSFILHIDSLSILEEMTNEQKGILFDAIYKHQIGINVELDFAMKMAFAPFKNQFLRDDEKYNSFIDKQKENGSKGGRPPKPKKPNENEETQAFSEEPKKAYNDSVSDSVNVSKNKKENKLFEIFWSLYDKKTDRPKCLKKFNSLSEQVQEKIIKVVPLYVNQTPDKQYRKNPLTWLNGSCWEDEYQTDIKTHSSEKKPILDNYYTQEEYEQALIKWQSKHSNNLQGHLL